MRKRFLSVLLPGLALMMGILVTTPRSLYAQGQGSGGGLTNIEAAQPAVVLHVTVDKAIQYRVNNGNGNGNGNSHGPGGASAPSNLSYHGGVSDGSAGAIGVETSPKVYLVLWGAQWGKNDPSGEATILQNFYNGAGGSSWLKTVTQYCQGVPNGTVFCNGSGAAAGNQTGLFVNIWADNQAMAPARPKQSEIAAEAINAAVHFGNTTAASNANVQYVIATASGNNATGFGSQYCAYHSATASGYGDISYTNLPYITDAGASCGAGFNGLGPDAGITIVAGHEMAESITDQFANGGWLDGQGEEIGDKCAWITAGVQGAATNTTLSTGTFPVQSLWSNAFNADTGGCVSSY